MPFETTTERRPATTTTSPVSATKAHHMGAPAPADQDPLPCPRCDSTNTKFCYYNNYNFSQPRHFCKSCRRYWTHGGTLRDIPVGGGCRKNAKRSRTLTPTFSPASSPCSFNSFSSSSSPSVVPSTLEPIPSTPLFVSLSSAAAAGPYVGDIPLKPTGGLPAGSFTSLLSATGPGGFLALGGFGLGLGTTTGLEEVGFGLGRGVWPFPEVGYLGGGGGLGGAAAVIGSGGSMGGACDGHNNVSGNTWQLESGENGFVGAGGECFSSPAWPELAISTPGNRLK
ncbi:hypothetical protein Dimus_017092 [Dionaea muscipula]